MMGTRDTLPLPTRTQQRIRSSDQGRMWTAALICASILASQEILCVSAFQIRGSPSHLFPGVTASSPSRLDLTATIPSATASEARIRASSSKIPPSMSPTVTMPSQMFLKAGQVSMQPMSSLASDFFDTTTTGTSSCRFVEDEVPIYIPQRARGILGFALNDQDCYHIASSAKSPPSMEETSTALHSSTEERQSYSSGFNLGTWKLPRNLEVLEDADDIWLSSPPTDDNRNPILNRSPSSSATAGEDQDTKESATPAWFPWMPSITQIEALKVRELKKICANRGLKQAGNKVELQQRLWDWTRTQQHRQRRLMIGSHTETKPAKVLRLETKSPIKDDPTATPSTEPSETTDPSETTANSLGEWARTYNIKPLLQQREKIHKEKREGKTVSKRKKSSAPGSPETPTKEYLSKLFDAPASQYSNLEVKQMYKAAKAADQNGDRTLSKQILLKLKDATPHDARIYRRLARMETEEGKVHLARKVLQEGLRLHPANSYLWHGLGQLEMKVGNIDESRHCFMKAIRSDPAFPNAYHALGTMEHSCGEIAKAMKIFKTGLQYCPTNHRLHHALGDLYREAKILDMADRSFRRALEHGPQVSASFSYTSLAHVSYDLGDINKCRTWLRKAVATNDGRSAKAWLAMARLEESENNINGARSVCMTALNQYEKGLLRRVKKGLTEESKLFATKTRELDSALSLDPVELKNQMLQSVPKYRSGDHFLKVYRNWLRLEEEHGTIEAVDDVYRRATTAFPLDWRLSVNWANYHVREGHHDRARLLFNQACDKAGSSNALPFRFFAEFEMGQGKYHDAREILYHGARTASESPDGGFGNHGGAAELYNTWAVCEWHLENLSRAEVLFDHALRLVGAGEDGTALRSYILYSIALLEYQRGEHHLAQHCVCLCLKENAMPGGNSMVWNLWSMLAEEMGDNQLAEQCKEQSLLAESKMLIAEYCTSSATELTKAAMSKMMRKDPWHHRLFDLEAPKSTTPSVALPDIF